MILVINFYFFYLFELFVFVFIMSVYSRHNVMDVLGFSLSWNLYESMILDPNLLCRRKMVDMTEIIINKIILLVLKVKQQSFLRQFHYMHEFLSIFSKPDQTLNWKSYRFMVHWSNQ